MLNPNIVIFCCGFTFILSYLVFCFKCFKENNTNDLNESINNDKIPLYNDKPPLYEDIIDIPLD